MAAHPTEELRQDLLARWAETHRKHHTVTHLHEMLDAIGLLADAGIEFDREAVELAAWFHDAVYEIGRDDNEDRSAELARELLASSPFRDEVARLVLVTKTHEVADDDVNGAVLSDADLSVLGSDAFRYRSYAAAVRDEYAGVPDEVSNRRAHRFFRHFSTGQSSTLQRAVSGGKRPLDATSPKRLRRSPAGYLAMPYPAAAAWTRRSRLGHVTDPVAVEVHDVDVVGRRAFPEQCMEMLLLTASSCAGWRDAASALARWWSRCCSASGLSRRPRPAFFLGHDSQNLPK